MIDALGMIEVIGLIPQWLLRTALSKPLMCMILKLYKVDGRHRHLGRDG